jgi:hypothetical protein
MTDKNDQLAAEQKKLQSWTKSQRKKLLLLGKNPSNRLLVSMQRARFRMALLTKRARLRALHKQVTTTDLPIAIPIYSQVSTEVPMLSSEVVIR